MSLLPYVLMSLIGALGVALLLLILPEIVREWWKLFIDVRRSRGERR